MNNIIINNKFLQLCKFIINYKFHLHILIKHLIKVFGFCKHLFESLLFNLILKSNIFFILILKNFNYLLKIIIYNNLL
jgi:hypothetical protein